MGPLLVWFSCPSGGIKPRAVEHEIVQRVSATSGEERGSEGRGGWILHRRAPGERSPLSKAEGSEEVSPRGENILATCEKTRKQEGAQHKWRQ